MCGRRARKMLFHANIMRLIEYAFIVRVCVKEKGRDREGEEYGLVASASVQCAVFA